ncbi:MAG: diacylglycerol kinase family protein, partial [Clostridia bacterium]|nr:diacylglycerol kinase family protein [Clostridia bacterium]
LNGVGYGIDGYCCEVGDELAKKSDKPVNYAGIAIKGLLFHYKPTNAVVTIDGKRREYTKVWLAPVMHGRRYGGGMIATPDQDRLDPERKLSVLVWHGSGKIPTLAAFPGIFKGEHIKHKKNVEVLTGRVISVEFDRPVAAQIDGETVLNVSRIDVKSAKAD